MRHDGCDVVGCGCNGYGQCDLKELESMATYITNAIFLDRAMQIAVER